MNPSSRIILFLAALMAGSVSYYQEKGTWSGGISIVGGSSHHEDSWAYINWLQTKDVIIVPAYWEPEDDEAVSQIESALPSYKGKMFKKLTN